MCVQVLSYNLYTVLNIPHDPVALEQHFQDDDEGPVSNHGYMPYLNKYILDKVEKREFVARIWLNSYKITKITSLLHYPRNASVMVISLLL